MNAGVNKSDVEGLQYSSVEEIRERFDNDVERFSSLETGQAAAMDSPLCMRLIAQAAATLCPDATSVLDVGCGAGNYTLTFLQELNVRGAAVYAADATSMNNEAHACRRDVQVTLLDLSRPMLERASERVSEKVVAAPATIQGDVREVELGRNQFDVILAAAVLHHLRDESQWHDCYAKLHTALKPGGTLWVYDMMTFDEPALDLLMKQRYMDYLETLGGVEYRQEVCAYIQKEDTPRSLAFQMKCMTQVGFEQPMVLHANAVFVAYAARRGVN